MKKRNFNTVLMAVVIFSAILSTGCEEEKYIYEPGNLVPGTVEQDPGLSSITVNGVMLHSEAFGHPDSTMIVCIHGGPGSDYRYLLNLKDLADYGYRVVFYDQMGSGLSQRFSKRSYTRLGEKAVDLMYDELNGVIDYYRTQSDQKVFLVGHSWGGMLATGFAGKHPDEIQGLVVCEPGGLKWEDVKKYVTESRSFLIWGETLNDATYLDQFITGREDEHEILDYKLALLASKNEITGEDNTGTGSFWRFGAVINAELLEVGEEYCPDFSQGVTQFKDPVLFFFSEKNRAYPDSWAQRVSSAYASAELVKIMGVGHDGILSDKVAWTEQSMPMILTYFNSL